VDLALPAVERLIQLAAEGGTDLPQLALSWLLSREGVATAVVGARTASHLGAAIDAAGSPPAPDLLQRLDEVVPPGTAAWASGV
jgi:aryl-alcohol dehydrogenase-like predicted oxidoreductase